MRTLILPVLLALLAASAAGAPHGDPFAVLESLESGVVRFRYPTRPGVAGDCRGLSIRHRGGRTVTHHYGDWSVDDYARGPAWVTCTVSRGRLLELQLEVGPCADRADAGVRDLGEVDPQAAAAWLLDTARHGTGDVAAEALTAALVARDAEVSAPLLELVRDRGVDEEVRGTALLWAAALAGEKVLGPVRDILDDPDDSAEVREHAVFALGQLEDERGLPILLDLARNHGDPRVRQASFFALTEFDDPAVVALLEEVLLGD